VDFEVVLSLRAKDDWVAIYKFIAKNDTTLPRSFVTIWLVRHKN
jgi:hypothetical protein